MLGIGEFFKKIQGSFAKEIFARTIVKEAIKKHTGADVPIEDISIKSATISLGSVNQATRSAVYIKKTAILKELTLQDELRFIKDIR